MCQLKSGIILKDYVFVPDYDHHSNMLDELKIKDTKKNAETKFIRAELLPPNGDVFSPVDDWVFNVDQDILPDWYVEEFDRDRFVVAIKKWADEHVHIGKNNLEIKSGGTHYLKNCKDATLRENSTATLWENSTATLRENSTATLRENSTATLWGNSTATLWGNSTATLRGNSTGIIDEWSLATRNNAILLENSTLKDCKTHTIYQSGDFKLVVVNEEDAQNAED